MNKTILKNITIFFLFFFSSCASFKKMDFFSRDVIYQMSKDKEIKPFSKILVRWRNYPFKTYQQTIGYTDKEKEKIKPVNVPYEDYVNFKMKIFKIFKEAGLYDTEKGTGTLKIELTTFGRWTYSELFSSYLTDTSFIYILPSSIKVNYYMVTEIEQGEFNAKVEEIASIKTTFHLLLFPLYPFTSFTSNEKSVLKQIIWKTACDIYLKQKNPIKENKENEETEKKLLKISTEEYQQDY